MSPERYIVGLLLLAAVLAAAAATAAVIVRRQLPDLTGVHRWLALGLLFTSAVIAGEIIPGALGILAPGTVLVATGLLALAAATLVPTSPRTTAAPEARSGWSWRQSPWLWVPALLGAWVVATYVVAYLATTLTVPTYAYDQTAFRLPTLQVWAQSGSIWGLELFLPRKNTGSYPQNGDLVILATLLPWGNDAFVRFAVAPFAAMSAGGVYAAARTLEVRPPVALAVSTAFVAMPVITIAAFRSGLPDALAVGCLAAGFAFLLRATGSGRRSDLVLAGLGIGLAFGTKWYGLEAAVLLLPTWAIARYFAGTPPRTALRDLGLVAGVVLAAGGFWLLRNLVATGNPMYPARAEPFGIPLLSAPIDVERDVYGLSISQYLGDWSALRHEILPAFWDQYALAGPLWAAAVVAGPVLAWRRFRAERDVNLTVLALSAFAVLMFAAYVITPYSAQGFDRVPTFTFVNTRWAVPALLAAAIVAAWVVDRLRSATVPLTVLLAAAAIQGARSGLTPPRWSVVVFGLVLAGALALAWMASRRQLVPRRPLALAAAGAAVACVAIGGYVVQRRFNDDRYLGNDPVLDRILDSDREQSVGIAGEFGAAESLAPWAAFGPDLDNDVEYVGRVVDGRLLPFQSPEEWRAALRNDGYDLLLVSKSRHPVASDPDEVDWAASTPELREIAEDERFRLYEVQG